MRRALPVLCALFAWAGAAYAKEDPVSVSAALDRAEIRPGEGFALRVTADIEPPWHIYAMALANETGIPSRPALSDGHPFRVLGPWKESPFHVFTWAGLGDFEIHEKEAVFTLPLAVPAGLAPGTYALSGVLAQQACTEEECLPTKKLPFSVEVAIVAGEPRPALLPAETSAPPDAGGAPPRGGSDVDGAIQAGLGSFLLLAVVSGLAALLMPCVYPMIPITVSFFAKEASRRGKPPVALGLLYAIGIVGTFTGVGLLFSVVLGGSINAFVANPWVNLTIAGLFFAFALSLFGLFEIQLPSFVVNAAGGADRSGALGVLVMGFAFSVASFTCTVQFVGTLLVMAAQGDRLWPVLGLLAFSGTLAAPFFLLSLFPSYAASAPRAGGWMHAAKIVFAWVEIAAVASYLAKAENAVGWGILSRPVVLSVWCFATAITALYLAGWCRFSEEDAVKRIGWARRALAAAFAALTLYLGAGLPGRSLVAQLEAFLPPLSYGMAGAAEASVWRTDLAAAEAEAKAAGKKLLLNFTGIT